MISVLFMYAFLALTFIVSKDLLLTIDPYLMIVVRMLGCSLLFLTYAYYSGAVKALSKAYAVSIIILGFFNVYSANILQLIGLNYIDPVNASLWYNSIPFVIALLDYVLYKTRISKTKIISLILGWLGFLPLVVGHASSTHYLYGAFLFVLSAIAMAISALLMEKNKAVDIYPLSFTNGLSMGVGGLFALMHYFFSCCSHDTAIAALRSHYGMLLVLIGSTAICASLYIYFVKKHSALLVTFAGFSLPLFSFLFEIILGNPVIISVNMIISAFMITAALFLFSVKK